MFGWSHGMDPGWWILMGVFWVAIIGVVVWAIIRLVPSRGDGRDDAPAQRETPEQILERRLARGEIDVEEYRRVKETLTTQHSGGGR